ncbi:hypothetical protein [Leuconostoc falkenbergense]
MITENLTNSNLNYIETFENAASSDRKVALVAMATTFLFSMGSGNHSYGVSLGQNIYNFKNSIEIGFKTEDMGFVPIKTVDDTLDSIRKVFTMDNDSKEFGALQEKTKSQEASIQEIKDSIKEIKIGIDAIKEQTAKIKTKEELQSMIEGAMNKRALWILGFLLVQAIAIIGIIVEALK